MRQRRYEALQVQIYQSNGAVGEAAARDLAEILSKEIGLHGKTSVIFATGNSQLSFMKALSVRSDIEWNKVTVFNMDSYLDLPAQHPASFTRYIREKLTDVVQPSMYYDIQGYSDDIEAEIERYTQLLEAYRPVACVMGIGENGHLAFNDPPAVFYTPKLVDIVTLTKEARLQQVNEGHFATLAEVPTKAITLTIPALLNKKHVLVVVPEARKAPIIKQALEGPIRKDCPATILRTLCHAKLYLDEDSASLLDTSH